MEEGEGAPDIGFDEAVIGALERIQVGKLWHAGHAALEAQNGFKVEQRKILTIWSTLSASATQYNMHLAILTVVPVQQSSGGPRRVY